MSDFIITEESPRHSNPFKSKKKGASPPLAPTVEGHPPASLKSSDNPFTTTEASHSEHSSSCDPPSPTTPIQARAQIIFIQTSPLTSDLHVRERESYVLHPGDRIPYAQSLASESSTASDHAHFDKHSTSTNDLDLRENCFARPGDRTPYASSLVSESSDASDHPHFDRHSTPTNDLDLRQNYFLRPGDRTPYAASLVSESSTASERPHFDRHSSPTNDLDRRRAPYVAPADRTPHASTTALLSDASVGDSRPALDRSSRYYAAAKEGESRKPLQRSKSMTLRAAIAAFGAKIKGLKGELERDQKSRQELGDEEYREWNRQERAKVGERAKSKSRGKSENRGKEAETEDVGKASGSVYGRSGIGVRGDKRTNFGLHSRCICWLES